MDFVSDADEPLGWKFDDDTYGSTNDLYAKRPGEDMEPGRRTPSKRVAFDPSTFGATGPGVRSGSRPNGGGQAPSSQRTPFPTNRQYNSGPRTTGEPYSSAQGNRTPDNLRAPPPQRVSQSYNNDPAMRADAVPLLPADALAESKGREMALKACRSLAVDASREAGLIIPAAKICAAGVLLNDQQMIEKGKDTARKGEAFLRRLQNQTAPTTATGQGTPGAGPSAVGQANALLSLPELYEVDTSDLDNGAPEASGPQPMKLSTCKVMVKVGSPSAGAVFEVEAIIDTGASQSALTIDVLRRMGLTKYIDTSKRSIFYNADGRKAKTLGNLNGFPVTLGRLTTKVTFSVTDALSYEVLLGMDFLVAVGAIIDLRSNEVKYDLGVELEGKKEITCYQPNSVEASINMMDDISEAFWTVYAAELSLSDLIREDGDGLSIKIEARPSTKTGEVAVQSTTQCIVEEADDSEDQSDIQSEEEHPIGWMNTEIPAWAVPAAGNSWIRYMELFVLPKARQVETGATDSSRLASTPEEIEYNNWVAVLRALYLHGYEGLCQNPSIVQQIAADQEQPIDHLNLMTLHWICTATDQSAKEIYTPGARAAEEALQAQAKRYIIPMKELREAWKALALDTLWENEKVMFEEYERGYPGDFTPGRCNVDGVNSVEEHQDLMGSPAPVAVMNFKGRKAAIDKAAPQDNCMSVHEEKGPAACTKDKTAFSSLTDDELSQQLHPFMEEHPLSVAWLDTALETVIPMLKSGGMSRLLRLIRKGEALQWLIVLRFMCVSIQTEVTMHPLWVAKYAEWVNIPKPEMVANMITLWRQELTIKITSDLKGKMGQGYIPFNLWFEELCSKYLLDETDVKEHLRSKQININYRPDWADIKRRYRAKRKAELDLVGDNCRGSVPIISGRARPAECMINMMTYCPYSPTSNDIKDLEWLAEVAAQADRELSEENLSDDEDPLIDTDDTKADPDYNPRATKKPKKSKKGKNFVPLIEGPDHHEHYNEKWFAELAGQVIPYAQAWSVEECFKRAGSYATMDWIVVFRLLHLFGPNTTAITGKVKSWLARYIEKIGINEHEVEELMYIWKLRAPAYVARMVQTISYGEGLQDRLEFLSNRYLVPLHQLKEEVQEQRDALRGTGPSLAPTTEESSVNNPIIEDIKLEKEIATPRTPAQDDDQQPKDAANNPTAIRYDDPLVPNIRALPSTGRFVTELTAEWIEKIEKEAVPVAANPVITDLAAHAPNVESLQWLKFLRILAHTGLSTLRTDEGKLNEAAVWLQVPSSYLRFWMDFYRQGMVPHIVKIILNHPVEECCPELYETVAKRYLLSNLDIKEYLEEHPRLLEELAGLDPDASYSTSGAGSIVSQAVEVEPVMCMMDTLYSDYRSDVPTYGSSWPEETMSESSGHRECKIDDGYSPDHASNNKASLAYLRDELKIPNYILHNTPKDTMEGDFDDNGIDVGYPWYNAGELPSFTNPGPILTPDDIRLGVDLTNEQRAALRQVLWDNQDAFAFTPEQLGRSSLVEFSIKLKEGAHPVAQPYHRTPFKHRPALKAEINKMLELGLIEPSDSPWASPIVMVPKKDGGLRMTIDYRKGPNTWAIRDSFPLPRLDEILALIGDGKARYFCAVDCTKGYLQICNKDRETGDICSISTPWGLFRPTVLMAGLTNGPAVWQRLMSIELAKHIGKELFVYMDDAVIIASTFEQLLENVAAVLQSFRAMGIRLAPAKCQFGVTILKFLGHIIGRILIS